MLYIKLILRGVFRHSKKGKKLFILLSLSIAAIIFAFAFKENFYRNYIDLGIDCRTGHLQIVSSHSSWFKKGLIPMSEDIPLIDINKKFEDFIVNLDGVEAASPIILTSGSYFTLDGEPQYEYELTGIDADKLFSVFPGIRLVKGGKDITYNENMENIPVLRWEPTNSDNEANSNFFVKNDFKYDNDNFEEFKRRFKNDFPSLFQTNDNIQGKEGLSLFINNINRELSNREFYRIIPDLFFEEYNYEIDDNIFYVMQEDNSERIPLLNKKIIQSLYPDMIYPIPTGVELDVPMTLMVPPSKSNGILDSPKVLPIYFTGFVSGMPHFYSYNYIDISRLREYLELNPGECTSYIIRLDDKVKTGSVKMKLESYLAENNLPYKVIDYQFMGKNHMPTAIAFDIVLNILIILFLCMVIMFIINTIMLAMIKRRKEIGISIILGMSDSQNIFIFLGEIFIIVFISWIVGTIIGGGLTLLFSIIGLGGIVFFPDSILYMKLNTDHIFLTYVLVMTVSLVSAYIPLISLKKFNPIEMLNEVK